MASFDDFLKMFAEGKGLTQPTVQIPMAPAQPADPAAAATLPPMGVTAQSPSAIDQKALDLYNTIKPQPQVEIPFRAENDPLLSSIGVNDQSNGNAVPSDAAPDLSDDKTSSMINKLIKVARGPAVEKGGDSNGDSKEAKPASLKDTEYEQASEKARQNRMYAGLLAAAEQAGAGIAGLGAGRAIDPSNAGLKMLQDSQNAPITDLANKRAAEKNNLDLMDDRQKNDPNSAVSKMMRDTILKLSPGMKIPDDFTAAQAEKVFPSVAKVLEQKNMEELKKLQYAQLAETKASRLQGKAQELDTKRIGDVSKKMVAELASSRGAFGKAALNLQTIQNAEALLNGQKNLDDLDPRQMSELARVLDRTLSGGTPTISGTEHLTPDSSSKYVAGFLEKIKNEPVGAGQGKFAEKFQHTFDREKQLASQQIQAAQSKILGGVNDIARRDDADTGKQLLQGVIEANGLRGSFNKSGVFVPQIADDSAPAAAAQPTQKGTITRDTAREYALKHNLDMDGAINLLTKAGYVIR